MPDPKVLPQVHIARSPRRLRLAGYCLAFAIPVLAFAIEYETPSDQRKFDIASSLIGLGLLLATSLLDRALLVITKDRVAAGFNFGFHTTVRRDNITQVESVLVSPSLRPVHGRDVMAVPWVNRTGPGILITRRHGPPIAVACDLPHVAIAAINDRNP